MPERLYVVNDDPQPSENHLVLENGSAVVCVMTDEAVARATAAVDRRLSVRRHSELSTPDQQQVSNALSSTA